MKYGFVYLWMDIKKNKFYVGCHWGTIDDGYICSSNWMLKTYKRRPGTFRRKILTSNISCRKEMLKEEYRWLSMIKEEELGKKYYNIHNHHFNHWTTNENTKLIIGKKISKANIGKKSHMISHTEESKQKIRDSLRKSDKQKNKFTPEVRKKLKEARAKRTEKDFQKIKDALAKVPKKHCIYCSNMIDPGNYKRIHDDKCQYKQLTSNWIV